MRLADALGGTAGAEIANVIETSAAIARDVGLPPARARAVLGEIDLNRRYLADHPVPRPGARVYDGGLVFERYAGRGLRLMPLATWADAQARRKAGDIDGMRLRLDAALERSVPTPGGSLKIEYLFPYGGGEAPWRSPMASAVAMDALARGFEVTGEERYRTAAIALLDDVLGMGRDEGENDLWFPLYPFAPDVHVLNANLQVTLNLWHTNDALDLPAARTAYDRSIATLLRRVERYDTGGWSLYSEGTEATLGYHDLQTLQLRQLANITGDPYFRTYSVRFLTYRRQDTRVTGPKRPPRPAYPWPRDGFKDDALVRFSLSKPCTSVTVVIRRAGSGRLLDRIDLGALHGGMHELRWRVPRGRATYRIDVTAIDLVGNRSSTRGVTTAEARLDTTRPRVRASLVGRRLRWRVVDRESPWITLTVHRRGKRVLLLPKRGMLGDRRLPARFTAAKSVMLIVRDSSGNATAVRVKRHGASR